MGRPASLRVDLAIAGARSLQVADFDGDGRPDLAVAAGQQIAIFLNKGNRSFRALAPFSPANWQGGEIVVADLDGDHRADLVLSLAPLTLSILTGNGDGTFHSPRSIYSTVPPNAVEPYNLIGPFLTGDFNGDGRADVAFAEGPLNIPFGGVNVTVLLNQGGLVFTRIQFQEGGFAGPSVLDANGDRVDDIGFGWLACHTPCAGADVWTGTPGGTMAKFLVFDTEPSLQSLAVSPVAADFNGNGALDVAFSMQSNSGFTFPPQTAHQSVLIFIGPITPSQSPPPTPVDYDLGAVPSFSAFTSAAMVTADFNGDGKPDLAVVSAAHDAIVLMLNTTPGGTFAAPPRDFGLALSATTATVKAGQSATFTATVTPSGGFSDNVSFSCSGFPTGAACNFTPATVTPGGNVAAVTTVTITSQARGTAALMRHSTGTIAIFLPVLAIAFAGIGWNANSTTRVVGLILIVVLLMALAACGGNASTPSAVNTPPTIPAPAPTSTGTPAGTYRVMVTATSAAASPITHSQTFTLVVQ
jgi:hypothetical protein